MRSARTRCRPSTRSCCSTGPRGGVTCSRSPTRWATVSTRTWRASQGVFHQGTPLTLAETASVFGETVTFGRLLDATHEPEARLTLLAESLEGQIATVFRQIAMNRFENSVHTARREQGELSVDDFNRHWTESQAAMLGDSVELTEGYGTWWSYVPHFIGMPGYVYAYAYGQLLALSVYRPVPGAGRGLRRRRTSSCSPAAARSRPRSSARSSASTSPIPRSGTAGCASSSSSSRRPRPRRSRRAASPSRLRDPRAGPAAGGPGGARHRRRGRDRPRDLRDVRRARRARRGRGDQPGAGRGDRRRDPGGGWRRGRRASSTSATRPR